MDRSLVQMVLLGLGFMLIFTAFQSCGFIQETVLRSSMNETGIVDHAGFYGLAVIYGSFTVCNFLAPPIVSVLGSKVSMLLGGLTYGAYLASFLVLRTWLFFTCSALLGLGAAVLWTAQGNFITVSSTEQTMGRNSGIVWAMFQTSLLLGSIFLYFVFQGKEYITRETRMFVYSTFTGLCGAGLVVLLFLRRPPRVAARESQVLINGGDHVAESPSASDEDYTTEAQSRVSNNGEVPLSTFWQDFRRTFVLLKRKELLLLAVVFMYTGIGLAFWSSVYGTCLSNTKQFGSNAFALFGLSGMFIGVGEIIGGVAFGLLGHKTAVYSRNPIVLLGFAMNILAYFLIFINIPNDSPMTGTDGVAYLSSPNQELAILCSFLLGFGDSCYNTQIYSILGSLFAGDSSPAFALFKLFQSLTAAASFFYSGHVQLMWQLLVLCVSAFFATCAFIKAENIAITKKAIAGKEI